MPKPKPSLSPPPEPYGYITAFLKAYRKCRSIVLYNKNNEEEHATNIIRIGTLEEVNAFRLVQRKRLKKTKKDENEWKLFPIHCTIFYCKSKGCALMNIDEKAKVRINDKMYEGDVVELNYGDMFEIDGRGFVFTKRNVEEDKGMVEKFEEFLNIKKRKQILNDESFSQQTNESSGNIKKVKMDHSSSQTSNSTGKQKDSQPSLSQSKQSNVSTEEKRSNEIPPFYTQVPVTPRRDLQSALSGLELVSQQQDHQEKKFEEVEENDIITQEDENEAEERNKQTTNTSTLNNNTMQDEEEIDEEMIAFVQQLITQEVLEEKQKFELEIKNMKDKEEEYKKINQELLEKLNKEQSQNQLLQQINKELNDKQIQTENTIERLKIEKKDLQEKLKEYLTALEKAKKTIDTNIVTKKQVEKLEFEKRELEKLYIEKLSLLTEKINEVERLSKSSETLRSQLSNERKLKNEIENQKKNLLDELEKKDSDYLNLNQLYENKFNLMTNVFNHLKEYINTMEKQIVNNSTVNNQQQESNSQHNEEERQQVRVVDDIECTQLSDQIEGILLSQQQEERLLKQQPPSKFSNFRNTSSSSSNNHSLQPQPSTLNVKKQTFAQQVLNKGLQKQLLQSNNNNNTNTVASNSNVNSTLNRNYSLFQRMNTATLKKTLSPFLRKQKALSQENLVTTKTNSQQSNHASNNNDINMMTMSGNFITQKQTQELLDDLDQDKLSSGYQDYTNLSQE